jgi:hypothetical protein
LLTNSKADFLVASEVLPPTAKLIIKTAIAATPSSGRYLLAFNSTP